MTIQPVICYLPGSVYKTERKLTTFSRYFPPNKTWRVSYDSKPGPCKLLTRDEIDKLAKEYLK